jgi:hypothetical protein
MKQVRNNRKRPKFNSMIEDLLFRHCVAIEKGRKTSEGISHEKEELDPSFGCSDCVRGGQEEDGEHAIGEAAME